MTPLKTLITYINENIYSKMKKKDVKEIKAQSLGGGLMDSINTYKNYCVNEALEEERRPKPVIVASSWDPKKVFPDGSIKN